MLAESNNWISSFFSTSSAAFNGVMFLITLISIALNIFFSIKSKERKEPTYRTRTSRLIRDTINKIDQLQILFNGRELPALTTSKIAFWNAGRETLNFSDVSENDKLRLVIDPSFEFLSCDILTQTKSANCFRAEISEDCKSILIQFDYMDFEDGVVLRVRHTGTSNGDIELCGSVKNVKSIKRKGNDSKSNGKPIMRRKLFDRTVIWAGVIVGLLLFLSGLFPLVGIRKDFFDNFFMSTPSNPTSFYAILMILGVVYFLPFAFSLRKPVPKALYGEYSDDDF